MKRALIARVERLENDRRALPSPEPTAADRLFRKKSQELLAGLGEQYARFVSDDLERNPSQPACWSGLTLALFSRVIDHIHEGRPLAFPAVVAQAYVDNPQAGDIAACLGCRYKLPRGFFARCPLCGEPVGPDTLTNAQATERIHEANHDRTDGSRL